MISSAEKGLKKNLSRTKWEKNISQEIQAHDAKERISLRKVLIVLREIFVHNLKEVIQRSFQYYFYNHETVDTKAK